jgi:hypothetical protein
MYHIMAGWSLSKGEQKADHPPPIGSEGLSQWDGGRVSGSVPRDICHIFAMTNVT